MTPLQNVAIAGVMVVKELLASGFHVVHDSFDSWKAALEGQDAIISFLTPPATEYQNLAADAAVAANVKRFIPSEWGMNTTILDNTIFGKLLSDKTTTQSHLAKLSKDNDFFSWTGISTGLWFDWGLENLSLGFDKKTRTVDIADSGSEHFQTTNLNTIAEVVAKVLRSPGQTADRYITIASFNISQREILALAEEISGHKWTVKPYNVYEAQGTAEQALRIRDFENAFYPLLHGRLLTDGANLALKPDQNFVQDVLGFQEEDPTDAIKAWLGHGQ
ncbi:hypothetical protein BGZ61DRAFT_495250 [Ilyonectria robusta]|uniref:uncharacterized protein n=1 Tax=Ilyonectria robusta TaxID=1079257 RepID=UPI001E8CC71E|nr:uncharacterized protein BGZ61DRAFT_495250 [Ilyonectria robusta]KAH8684941.1 hypothetical protein BGZ61DRAFT_495250 [Ilyonectria robusta]